MFLAFLKHLKTAPTINRIRFLSTKQSPIHHIPVMSEEVLSIFNPQKGQTFLDLTFGAGGHTKLLLNSCKDVTVYGLDRDPVAYELAVQTASTLNQGVLNPLIGRFSDLSDQLRDMNIGANFFDGVLIDCGCSSMQFDNGERGFSISRNGPLDMRMDRGRIDSQPSAADVLANISEENLARVLKVYGEEKQSKKIARAVIEARYMFKRLRTTSELAQLVESVYGFSMKEDKLQRPSHVATKTFQALRILVNDELNELNYAMNLAHLYLKKGGKVIAISFHSLEDRVVKSHLTSVPFGGNDQKSKNYAAVQLDKNYMDTIMERPWTVVNKHVIAPTEEEVAKNPRSRSAKLRAAVKSR